MPQFAHLPMVLGSSKGEKLSKRHGATSIEQYRNEGYLPQAMINFLPVSDLLRKQTIFLGKSRNILFLTKILKQKSYDFR
jgi:glutamyl/glutaminyl-tRNA synthetase